MIPSSCSCFERESLSVDTLRKLHEHHPRSALDQHPLIEHRSILKVRGPQLSIKALVLRTAGTNCDAETVHALKVSGADPDLRHVRELIDHPEELFRYKILVLPGGFSYGDDIAAGRVLANELKHRLGPDLLKFVKEKRLVIGVCNGFQVLVKLGLLPGTEGDLTQNATLAHNDSGRFQCHWVGLKKESSCARWLNALPSEFELPMAHGEGKFLPQSGAVLKALQRNKQIVFRYAPFNPNGSTDSIAGITNPLGNVLGLMPHPERYLFSYQHPDADKRKEKGATAGAQLWQCAVQYAKKL